MHWKWTVASTLRCSSLNAFWITIHRKCVLWRSSHRTTSSLETLSELSAKGMEARFPWSAAPSLVSWSNTDMWKLPFSKAYVRTIFPLMPYSWTLPRSMNSFLQWPQTIIIVATITIPIATTTTVIVIITAIATLFITKTALSVYGKFNG